MRVFLFFTILNFFGFFSISQNCSNPVFIGTNSSYQEGFETSLGGWQNTTDPKFNFPYTAFSLQQGATPNPTTGPNAASEGNQYIYVNSLNNGNIALLESPCFDFSGAITDLKMKFKLHAYSPSTNNASIRLIYSLDQGATWSFNNLLWVYPIALNNNNQWVDINIDLSSVRNASGMIFRFFVSTPMTGTIDIAIDDVQIEDGPGCPPAGTACDDGNPFTDNDIADGNCGCSGTPIPCNFENLAADNFESGWGVWNDGGSDSRRLNNSNFANTGDFSIRLRDNSSTSVMTTDAFDLSDFQSARLAFTYITDSFDNSREDFFLEISTDNGATYNIVEEWNLNDEFVNGVRYFDAVDFIGPFSSNTKFRFRCDASGNGDRLYIDDVRIVGCRSVRTLQPINTVVNNLVEESISIKTHEKSQEQDAVSFSIYPNPAKNFQLVILNLDTLPTQSFSVQLFDFNGTLLGNKKFYSSHNSRRITLNEIINAPLKRGIYFVKIVGSNTSEVKQLIIE